MQEGRADEWRCFLDTGLACPDDIAEAGKGHLVSGLHYLVKAWSIVVLEQ